ncbi:MAG: outer membrane beta-barrel protein, partial [Acidobacteria bacterium]|nr:outer membrane beta-barrel protein [Acidobacteriota bacterium]
LNYDDEGSIGHGVTGGGGVGYRLWQRFGVEGEFSAFRTRRELSSFYPPFEASGVRVMGNGLLYLNRGPAQAYLLFGAGMIHVRNEVSFGGIRSDRATNGLNLGAGFGVRIFVNPRFSLRPEVRLDAGATNGSIEAPFTSARFSIGAAYHW